MSADSPMCQIAMKLEQAAEYFAGPTKKLKHPTGSPCEIEGCGNRSVWNLKRREAHTGSLGGSTSFDPESPEHPRCIDQFTSLAARFMNIAAYVGLANNQLDQVGRELNEIQQRLRAGFREQRRKKGKR